MVLTPDGADEDGGPAKATVRDRVLTAALAAIAERGPEQVRVNDIATRAGMSAGHVLYYFGRRDRILIETLLLSETDLAERRQAELARFRDPWRAIDRFVTLYLPVQADDPRWNLWMQIYARPPKDHDTQVRLGQIEDGWAADLATLVDNGLRKGRFQPPGDDFAVNQCKFLDGLALDVLLGLPTRDVPWALRTASTTLRSALRA